MPSWRTTAHLEMDLPPMLWGRGTCGGRLSGMARQPQGTAPPTSSSPASTAKSSRFTALLQKLLSTDNGGFHMHAYRPSPDRGSWLSFRDATAG